MATVVQKGSEPDLAKKYQKQSYEDYEEIIENIKKNEPMSPEEKYVLQYNINEVLKKEDHEEIIKIVIQNTNKKIYTSNMSVTFFDLCDLSNSALWKLHYYVNFCLENIKKGKKVQEALNESKLKKIEFEQKMQEELQKKLENGEIEEMEPVDLSNKLYLPENVPSYDTLRNQALFHVTPVHAERIKVTQMKQLNKLKELEKKQKSTSQNIVDKFFKPYIIKKNEEENEDIKKTKTLEKDNDNNNNDIKEDVENEDNEDNEDNDDEDDDNETVSEAPSEVASDTFTEPLETDEEDDNCDVPKDMQKILAHSERIIDEDNEEEEFGSELDEEEEEEEDE